MRHDVPQASNGGVVGICKDDLGTKDEWIPRDPELIRLTGRHPFNWYVESLLPCTVPCLTPQMDASSCSEPKVAKLAERYITHSKDHYVRNHGAVPRKTWEEHRLQVTGTGVKTQTFTMDEIIKMPSIDVTCTLTCAGNRRKEQNMHKQTIGFSWGSSGTSCSTWTGVRLGHILEMCGVSPDRRSEDEYVWLDGPEGELPAGEKGIYGTSITMLRALDPTYDVILAYKQNGEWLTPDHGFPIRIIIPGYIGGRMIKFIEKITVSERESDNHYHYMDNRVLPSHVDAETATKEGWWYQPDFIINDLNINSAIFSPNHADIVPFESGKSLEATGYAYSNGNKIIRCEISIDGCKTWRLAEISSRHPPNKYGKHWAWVWWKIVINHDELVGTEEIVCRAWDSAQNTQPNSFTWNVMGMMNNCVFRCKVHKEPHDSKFCFRFEHPTVAGANPGGWMERESFSTTISAPEPPKVDEVAGTAKFTMEEVESHDSKDSAWFVYHDKVYDATPFLKDHPGGSDSILLVAGTDATEEFDAIHSTKAKNMLLEYYIGDLISRDLETPSGDDAVSPASSSPTQDKVIRTQEHIALNPKKKLDFPLIEKFYLTHNVVKLRFGLPSEAHKFGLPVGKHIFLYAKVNGETVMRAYTPTSSDHDLGYFDLVIKVYRANENLKFLEGGKMSQHLDRLAIGDFVTVKGPVGHVEYLGRGKYLLDGEERFTTAFNLLAGGTGITPCYQIVKSVLRDPEDTTKISLLYANTSEVDILLRDELDQLSKDGRFNVWYTLTSPPENWNYSTGYISLDMCKNYLLPRSENTVACMCGPPPMIEYACKPSLIDMGFDESQMIEF